MAYELPASYHWSRMYGGLMNMGGVQGVGAAWLGNVTDPHSIQLGQSFNATSPRLPNPSKAPDLGAGISGHAPSQPTSEVHYFGV